MSEVAGAGVTEFDLITVDVVEPRAAAAWCNQHVGLVILEDEDDGRWVVVGTPEGHRRLGFQRSTPAEVRNRTNGQVRVRLTSAHVSDPVRLTPGDAVNVWPASHEDKGHVGCEAEARIGEGELARSIAFWTAAVSLQSGRSDSADDWPWADLVGADGRTVLTLREDHPDTMGTGETRSLVHLDLMCDLDRFEPETVRLLHLGAVRVGPARDEHWGHSQIFTAPDGIVFCLNAYHD